MKFLTQVKRYANDITHLFYPHVCLGCGSDIIDHGQSLCAICISALPATDYFKFANNPVEQLFAGRLLIEAAGSAFYFTKQSLLQNVMFEIKYRGNQEMSSFIGKQIGLMLQESQRFNSIDIIVPLPLSEKRLQQRGYNQAALTSRSLAHVIKKSVVEYAVFRKMNTATQTGKDRSNRWQTMQDVFAVSDAKALEGKHILLVDDIVTTGATLEACGETILSIPNTRLSIATAAYTI